MATAIIAGMAGGGFDAESILGCNLHRDKAEAIKRQYGIVLCDGVDDLCERADVIVLAVKPQVLPDVLPIVDESAEMDALVISIAAGKPLGYLENALGRRPIVRAMPNLNAAVGASATGICKNDAATEAHLAIAKEMFLTVGSVTEIPEKLFPVFSAVAGASPAFTFKYIDALARAGVREGMPRAMALEAAANSVLGSAKLVLSGTDTPAALADRVCSPGGTTIEGVMALDEYGFDAAVHEAVAAVVEKDKKLSE